MSKREDIKRWIEVYRGIARGDGVSRATALRVLAALEEAVTVIDGECLPGEIDACFERLLAILQGKREEPGDGKG